MEKHVQEIVEWLRKMTEEAGLDGLLVGVSGGLDSAVVASLIQRAYPDNSLGVMLPIHTSEKNMRDSKEVIDACGIKSMKIDLTNTHTTMYEEIIDSLKETNGVNKEMDQLANANLRARLRMSALYTAGAHYKYLVVGTDNASEWFTGYFTKYGDGGVDIQPLVDFTKSEVREMAKYLEVPNHIVSKVPSADLWEEQSDEAEMGVSYDVIDAYLSGEKIKAEDQELIESMHRRSMHKRENLPAFKRK